MKEQLQAALKDAMRNKDKVRLETIRSVIAAIQYEEMEKKIESLPPEGCLTVIQRELKKRKEEVEFAGQAGREDLKDKLAKEIAILEAFLPKQMSAEEIENFIKEQKAATPALNLGMAMKALKEKYAGQYDSKAASEIAKKLLA